MKQEALYGGKSIDEAAKLFMNILNGEDSVAQNNAICANAAVAVNCGHPELSLMECFEKAKKSLVGKKGFDVYSKPLKMLKC